jgi:hypothetical protein
MPATTTPTRRTVFRGIGLTSIAAGLAARSALASAAPGDSADAELVALCAKFVALETERYLLHIHDVWAPDFGPNHERYEGLSDEQQHTIDMIEECEPPTGPRGYVAVARAALAWAEMDRDGNFVAGADFCEEMMIRLALGAAGDFVWPPRPGSCPTAHWAPPPAAPDADVVPARIGNWDPCFKPGPCPCSDPCAWVAGLTHRGSAVA